MAFPLIQASVLLAFGDRPDLEEEFQKVIAPAEGVVHAQQEGKCPAPPPTACLAWTAPLNLSITSLVCSLFLNPNMLQEHAAARARYDTIRALLRFVAWLGFTARAAAVQASAGLIATMALASVVYSFAPVALLALNPEAFLRWA